MAEGELVHLERRDDGVAVLRLDHPKVNSLSRELLGQLHGHVRALQADLPGAVVVLGSDRIFAAGAEISEFGGPADAARYGGEFRQTFDALAALPRATVAGITGYALGGGLELALACDFRIAADNAKLGQPEILLGIIPGGGGTQRLPRLIGPARAKHLILTGRQVKADEALALGLVDEVVPAAELAERALAFAGELAGGAVVAQGLAKQAIDEGLETTLEDGLQLEQDRFVDVFNTEDSQIGVQSFLEHGPGKARFTGR
jgi:enoyl-CoA hydratase/carnithine racemase